MQFYCTVGTKSHISMGTTLVKVCYGDYQAHHRSLNKPSFSGQTTNMYVSEQELNPMMSEVPPPKNVIK